MAQQQLQPLDDNWQTGLAIVAHPDDLEYGAASAIAKWTSEGKTITYLLVSRGEAGIQGMDPKETWDVRTKEEVDSAAVVGVTVVEWLDYPDGTIEYSPALRRDITRAIRTHKPDIIITGNFHTRLAGGRTNQADHRSVGLAALDASRDAGNRWIFPELLDEGYEPWSGVKRVLISGSPLATHAVDVGEFIYKGVESLEKHDAYIKGLGTGMDPEMFLTMNANATGQRFDCDYAVSFEVYDI